MLTLVFTMNAVVSKLKSWVWPARVPKNIHVHVEGNIGSGKSSVIRELAKLKLEGITLYQEPVEIWTNVRGINFLDLVSKSPKKWGFEFQCIALTTLWKQKSKPSTGMTIFERSMKSSVNLFGESQLWNHVINQDQFTLLEHMCQWMSEDIKTKSVYIYLQVDPEVSFKRANLRARPEERTLSLEYFKQLHIIMDKWMFSEKDTVYLVDASQSPEDVLADVRKAIDMILEA